MKSERSNCRHAIRGACILRLVSILVIGGASAQAGQSIKWTGGADNASWHLAGNWNLGRVPGSGDDVEIPDVGGTTQVTYSKDTTKVQSVTTEESLVISGGTLEVVGLLSAKKDVTLGGGILKKARFTSNSGARLLISASGGTFDGVTIAGVLEGDVGYAYVVNGLTLDGGTVKLHTRSPYEVGYLYLYGNTDQSIGGNGEIVLSRDPTHYYSPALYLYGSAKTTIGPDVTIRGEGVVQAYSGNPTLVNQGIIRAEVSGKKFDVGSGLSWTNTGKLEALNGSILSVLSRWDNADGEIVADASTVNLGGFFDFDELGSISSKNGALINLTGKLFMGDEDTLTFNSTTGSWYLRGGSIIDGRLAGQSGKRLEFTTDGGTLDGVTLALDVELTSGGANIVNGLTLESATVRLGTKAAYEYGYLYIYGDGAQTIGGAGQFLFSKDAAHYYYPTLYLWGSGQTTIGPNVTLRGEGIIVGYSGSPILENQGTIRADTSGRKFEIGTNLVLTNTGTLEALNGGTLNLLSYRDSAGGTIRTDASTLNLGGLCFFDGLGTISNKNGGVINLTGKLIMEADDTLTFNSTTGSWYLRGGTIVHGRLAGQGGARLEFTTDGGTLDGVTVGLNLENKSGYAYIDNGLTLDNATISFGTKSQYEYGYFLVLCDGAQTLGGTGQFVFSKDPAHYYTPSLYLYGTGETTIGPSVTLKGEGSVVGYSGAPRLANEGLISANTSGKKFEVGSNLDWSNAGKLEAINGGVLNLLGRWGSTGGSIRTDASTINLGGVFTRAGLGSWTNLNSGVVNLTGKLTMDDDDTLQFNTNTGTWNLRGGTIVHGRLTGQSGKRLEFTTDGGTLNGVTVGLDLELNSGYAYIQNGLTLENAIIRLSTKSQYEYGYLFLYGDGSQTIGGTGEFVLSKDAAHYYTPSLFLYGSGQTTIGPDVVIRGQGAVITYTGTPELVNMGVIRADSAAKTLDVGNSAYWTNLGTLEARDTGELRTGGTWTNEGLINLGVGSKLSAGTGFTQSVDGVLRFTTAGTTADKYGRLVVTGTAALDGTLSLRTAGGYTPSTGHKFGFLTCTTRSGVFPIEDFLDGSGACHRFKTNYSGAGAEVETLAADNTDSDGDGVCDASDNCKHVANADQNDTDGDGIGDVCEETNDIRGDANCDGGVDFDDIDCFVASLIGQESWDNCGHGSGCDYVGVNDINQDGSVDFDDIDAFVECLINGGCL